MVQIWAIREEVPTRCANTGKAITRRPYEGHVMQPHQNTSYTPKDQGKALQGHLTREQSKEHCICMLKVAMRHSDDQGGSGLIGADEAQVSTLARQCFNLGLKGGVQ